MIDDRSYAFGVIACGSSYNKEREVYVLRVRRGNRNLLEACQRAFGGKLYRKTRGCYTWVLRGKKLKAFIESLPEYYHVL